MNHVGNQFWATSQQNSIIPDSIFYPEKPSKDSQIEELVRMLYNCDERSMNVIRATVKASLEGQRGDN
jgi:hypothetical protein